MILVIVGSGCGGSETTDSTATTAVNNANVVVSGKVNMPNNGEINPANYPFSPIRVNRIGINNELDKFKITAEYNNVVKTEVTDDTGKYSFSFDSGKGDLLLTAEFEGNVETKDRVKPVNKIKLMKRIASPTGTKVNEDIDSSTTAMELCYAKLRQSNDFDYGYLNADHVKTLYDNIKDSLEVILLNGTTAETVLKDDKINDLVVIASNNLIPQLVPGKPESIVVIATNPITFTWTEVERAMTYEIYLNDKENAFKYVTENQTSLDDLQVGNHTIWIKSANVFGKSGFSDSRQIIK